MLNKKLVNLLNNDIKMNKHGLNLDDFILDEIESIELIGDEDTIDITVEDTHMFFANGIYTHNSSLNSEVVEADKMGGSIKKGQVAHFIMSVGKSLQQRETHKATITILKSRFGKDGMIFEDVEFDNSRIAVSMDNTTFGVTRTEIKNNTQKDNQQRVAEIFNNRKNLLNITTEQN